MKGGLGYTLMKVDCNRFDSMIDQNLIGRRFADTEQISHFLNRIGFGGNSSPRFFSGHFAVMCLIRIPALKAL